MTTIAGHGGFRAGMQRRPADPGRIEKARDPRNALTRLFMYLKPFTAPILLVLVLIVIYTVLGTCRLQGIEPFAWVLNRSLAAAGPKDPVLRRRAATEAAHVERVRRELAGRVVLIPWRTEAPVGADRLRALVA